MAITPTDFEKIWSTNASTPAYTFSDADYLEGWDFVGNLPPTRAMWNAMQKSTDEKMKYVFDNFGAPLVATTVAEMTLQNRVYVYTGSEAGYTAGDWYYYDEGTSSWVDGGVYNAVAVQTDTTLTQAGEPADAKATGDRIDILDDVNFTEETIDWSDYATETYTLGWRKGYFNSSTGAPVVSDKYLRSLTANEYIAKDNDVLLTFSVPTGRHGSIYEYDSSLTYKGRYGSITDDAETVSVRPTPGYKYRFAIGQWAGLDAGDYLTEAFISQVVLTVAHSNITINADNIEEIQSELGYIIHTDTLDWTDYSTETYPVGWKTGYYNSTTGEITTSNVYIRSIGTRPYVATQGDLTLDVHAPNGYAVAVFEYASDGTYKRRYGNQNSTEGDATQDVSVNLTEGNLYKFSVGRFNGGDADDYVTSAFCNQITVTIKSISIGRGNVYKPKTGTYEFFTVDVPRPLAFGGEEVATTTETVECVLRLPDTYDPNGEPTRLIFACHGASGYIQASSNKWYNSMWKEFIDTLLDVGYACFDCNVVGGNDTDLIGLAMGSPLYVNVAKTAYDYIQQNYNVKKEIFVHGTSMGGVGATAFAHAFPQLVLAESSFAGRDVVRYIWSVKDNNYAPITNMATVYGYGSDADFIADKWSHIDGNAPSLALIKYNSGVAEFPPDRATDFEGWCDWFASLYTSVNMETLTAIRTVPYKSWNSWTDVADATRFDQKLVSAYNRGSACPSYGVVYDSATHTELSYGQINDMRNQLIQWYKRWEK